MMWEGKLDLSGSKKIQLWIPFWKYLCFINCGEFLEWLSFCFHFKKHIAPWRFFSAYWVLSHYWSDYNRSKIDLFQLQNLRSYQSVNPPKMYTIRQKHNNFIIRIVTLLTWTRDKIIPKTMEARNSQNTRLAN
jgi:hypothetical protein